MFGYGNQRLGWTACLLSAILVLTASGMVAWASQDDEERETFVAFAVNMSESLWEKGGNLSSRRPSG